MKDWFLGLEPRERWLVAGTGLLLALVIAYVGILEPIYKSAAERSQRVEQKRQDLAWMKSAAGEIQALRAGNDSRPITNNESLVVVINRTARESGLGAPTRTQPAGKGVRVTFKAQAFDKVVGWLATLQQRHGLIIDSASFDRGTAPGVVNATLTLERQ